MSNAIRITTVHVAECGRRDIGACILASSRRDSPGDYRTQRVRVRFHRDQLRVGIGRTRRLHAGDSPIGNPVVIRALRRDTVEVPSGRYPTGVVRPPRGNDERSVNVHDRAYARACGRVTRRPHCWSAALTRGTTLRVPRRVGRALLPDPCLLRPRDATRIAQGSMHP